MNEVCDSLEMQHIFGMFFFIHSLTINLNDILVIEKKCKLSNITDCKAISTSLCYIVPTTMILTQLHRLLHFGRLLHFDRFSSMISSVYINAYTPDVKISTADVRTLKASVRQ